MRKLSLIAGTRHCCPLLLVILSAWLGSHVFAQETLEDCLQELSDENWRVRRAACVALGEMGVAEQKTVSALTTRLDDEDSIVRYAAAVALGELAGDTRSAIPSLIRVLDQDYVGVAASNALRAIGRNAVMPLADVASNSRESESLRIAALEALARFGPDAREAIPPVLHLLRGRSLSIEMLTAICHMIGEMGSEARQAAPVLLDLCNSSDSVVRLEAARTLGKIGPLRMTEIHSLVKALQEEQETMTRVSRGLKDPRGKTLSGKAQDAQYRIWGDAHRCGRVIMEMTSALSRLQTQLQREDARLTIMPALIRVLEYPHHPSLIKPWHERGEPCYCPHCSMYIEAAEALRFYGAEAKTAIPTLEELLEYEAPKNMIRGTIAVIQSSG